MFLLYLFLIKKFVFISELERLYTLVKVLVFLIFITLCYLIHKIYPTSHLSFQELVYYGKSHLWVPPQGPTACLVSNLSLENLISSVGALSYA